MSSNFFFPKFLPGFTNFVNYLLFTHPFIGRSGNQEIRDKSHRIAVTLAAGRVIGGRNLNGCAFFSMCDRAKVTLLKEMSNLWLSQIYKRPSVLSSFILLFKNGGACTPKEHAYGKTKKKYPGVNFPGICGDEITNDCACEDNIPNVNTDSGNSFELVIVQNNHQLNNIIGEERCQGRFGASFRVLTLCITFMS